MKQSFEGNHRSVISGLSHIAIAVPSLESVEPWLGLLGNSFGLSRYSSADQGVDALVAHLEECDIEFITPNCESSTIKKFMVDNPRGGLHHVCFYVSDLELAKKVATEFGVRSITRGLQRGVVHNSPIAFFNPRNLNGVLVEFEEKLN